MDRITNGTKQVELSSTELRIGYVYDLCQTNRFELNNFQIWIKKTSRLERKPFFLKLEDDLIKSKVWKTTSYIFHFGRRPPK